MGLLVYGLLTVLLAASVVRKRSSSLLFLLQLLPILFLFSFLWVTRDRYPVLLVKKLGYEFEKVGSDYKRPSREVTIGGNQQKDDIFVPALPGGSIRLIPSLRANVIDLEASAGGALILRNGTPLNLIYLRDGDVVESKSASVTFRSSGSWKREFESKEGTKWEWPRKSWNVARVKEPPVAGSLTPRLYSLSEIGGSADFTALKGTAAGMERFHFSKSRQPLQFNRVFLAGAGNRIKINGTVPQIKFSFVNGDRLEIFAIESRGEDTRLRKAADFVLRNEETFRFVHLQPETMGIKEELLKNGTDLNKPLLISTSTLPYSMFPTAQYKRESAKFSGNFAFVQTDQPVKDENFLQQAREKFLDFLSLGNGKVEVVTDSGKYQTEYGGTIAIGKEDRILFSLDRVRFPWPILRILIVLFLLKMLFQPPFYSPFQNGYFQLIVILIDFFLVTRFLFSFRAASLYPFSAEAMELSLFALLLVPYLLFSAALLLKLQWERKESANFAMYTATAAAACYLLIPGRFWLMTAVCVILSTFAVYRFTKLRTRYAVPYPPALTRWNPLHWLVAFTAMALALQWLGAGEAVRIAGIRVPLAIAYHPIFLLLVSATMVPLVKVLEEGDRLNPAPAWKLIAMLAAVFLSFFVISFAVADFGFFLLFCLPVLFVLCGIGVMYLRLYEIRWKAVGAAMAAPAVVFLFLFSSYSTISKVLPESYSGNRYIQRVLLSVNPQALEETGLVAAEKQLGHQRTFMAYAHAGLTGGGYMGRAISPALGATSLNDNVPSAFLLNDFGMAGFGAVLSILAGIAWFWWRGMRNTSTLAGLLPPRFIGMLSLCALVTLLYTDLYMILANCGIFLFTGKNVFLWGLNSVSDIFHSAVIFAFILLPGILNVPAANSDHLPATNQEPQSHE